MKYAPFIIASLMLVGCGSDQISNEEFIAGSATCQANGFEARPIKSQWDGEVTGIQCYKPTHFNPSVTEYTLEDGTRCVVFGTRAPTSRRAGFSGVSCDWKD